MNSKESIIQRNSKDKPLLNKVLYRLMEVRGIEHPCTYFGENAYRRIRSAMEYSGKNLRLSKIRWLAEQFDVPPQFIINIVERSKKGEEGFDVKRTNK